MKYFCTNCNYSYDKSFGDKIEGIEIGIELIKCPICEEYDTFFGIKEEVNYISKHNLSSLEKDHFPNIQIIDSKIIVQIGLEDHPMGEEHRIASVGLYDEYGDLIEINYLQMHDEPIIEFTFDDLDKFEIRIKCSIHGVFGKIFNN